MSKEVVIVAAQRTAIGNFLGGLSSLPGHKLGVVVIEALLKKTGVAAKDISEVILGQVLTAGFSQNPARQASIGAKLPVEVPAWGINQVCGSGLRAVALGYQAILNGDSSIVIAGGQESMSQSMHATQMRFGVKYGNASLIDTCMMDGLTDAFSGKLMGITAENVAKKFNITRAEQDAFSATSQNKAEAAQKADKFKEEIVPVVIPGKKGDVTIDKDEFPRHGSTPESLGALKPAFDKEGTVTAGNASGINDGAAAVMLMTAEEAKKRGLKPLAKIVAWAHAGVEPDIMGVGPIYATRKCLEKAGWKVGDLDLIEANEAFAAQAIAVNKELGWDIAKVNVNGGAIALGHPVGATGARLITTILHELERTDATYGLISMCCGGALATGTIIERI